jgi:hypothetical protein
MIHLPANMGAFQFVALARLRMAQLMRGCAPKVGGLHKAAVMAQHEVSQGKVTALVTQLNLPDDGLPNDTTLPPWREPPSEET